MLALLEPPAWQRDAACREHDPSWWFPSKGQSSAVAKSVCRNCLVREECLRFALASPAWLTQGVWGGLSRRELRRARELGTGAEQILAAERAPHAQAQGMRDDLDEMNDGA